MNATLRSEYRKTRAAHPTLSAKIALSWAKTGVKRARRTMPEFSPGSPAKFRCKGFDVTLSAEYDSDADLTFYGTYNNHWAAGCIDRKANGDMERNQYRYFHPCNSFESHFRSLLEMKFPRHEAYELARKYVREDYKAAEAFRRGDRAMYVVNVTVSRKGVELATDSIGGCDYDDLRDVVEDNGMIDSAIDHAKARVAELCRCRKESHK